MLHTAHPRVWVRMKSELVYGADGSLTEVRHHWTFDDMFSAFATEGMYPKEKKGIVEQAPLQDARDEHRQRAADDHVSRVAHRKHMDRSLGARRPRAVSKVRH